MANGYLLNRILLKFKGSDIHQDLSGVILVDDQLWLASDETTTLECLTRIDSCTFGMHQSYSLADLIEGFREEEGEIDIEGLAYEAGYLWVVGSHSNTRKAVKKGKISDLKTITSTRNRYLLARIPLIDGELQPAGENLRAACLERSEDSNTLITALQQDEYLAPFLTASGYAQKALPGKDNGFDVEGLVIAQGKILLGLRGPVLRGIAIILEIEVEEATPGILQLKSIGKNGELYKKHFVDLDGFGVRDLRSYGNNVLILAGPTLDLDGSIRVFCLKYGFALPDQSYSTQDNGELEALFEIPYGIGCDRAEGMTLFPGIDKRDTILVVYDSPDDRRRVKSNDVLADVFTLT